MLKAQSRCLILFAREPVAGRVKTRLEPALGIHGTLTLYQQLLNHQLKLVNHYSSANAQLWIDGDPEHPDFSNFNGVRYQQQGEDLGVRMCKAIYDALGANACVVLIGSDCPEIDKNYLDRAFDVLEKGADAVFGPAEDGGYVLIGTRVGCKEIFSQIEWGSSSVMDQTRLRMKSSGLHWEELETLHDIDEPIDLEYLKESGLLSIEN